VQDAQQTARDRLTRARAWLSLRYPFLAVLALHLPDRAVPSGTASTDGRTLEYHPEYLAVLSDEEARGLLLHLVLHAAFGHAWRRAARDLARWERACDIVVNGVVRRLPGVRLPAGADSVDAKLEAESVEFVYEQLPELLEPPSSGATTPTALNESVAAGLESFWAEARQAAERAGEQPGPLERHYPKAKPSLNWRDRLTRYLVTSARDYVWNPPDRRMMAHDLLYPSLAGETARVAVAVDTSGSVSLGLIGRFLAEVRAIACSHPDISGLVLYADAAVHEVHDLARATPPRVIGGGGTVFDPVWQELERRREVLQVLVYLTDGQPLRWPSRPMHPVVWVIPESLAEVTPPFGEVLRLPE
jgi:predicted metal-dependent peptidase